MNERDAANGGNPQQNPVTSDGQDNRGSSMDMRRERQEN